MSATSVHLLFPEIRAPALIYLKYRKLYQTHQTHLKKQNITRVFERKCINNNDRAQKRNVAFAIFGHVLNGGKKQAHSTLSFHSIKGGWPSFTDRHP